jgi:AcrR family transcriptional regulator
MKGDQMPRSKQVSEQMRAESKAALISSARHLFAECGYFQCKVSDIARAANMSQGNVYWYFSSKEDLLEAVLAESFESLGVLLEETAELPITSIEKLDYLLDRYIAFSREHGDFVRIFISLLAHGGVALMEELGFDTPQIGLRYHTAVSTILAHGQEEGVISKDINVDVLTTFYFSFFNGLLFTYGDDWLQIPDAVIREVILRLLGVQVASYH